MYIYIYIYIYVYTCMYIYISKYTNIIYDPLPCAPLVFKNQHLRLVNVLAGKLTLFFQILICSYPPFRLV